MVKYDGSDGYSLLVGEGKGRILVELLINLLDIMKMLYSAKGVCESTHNMKPIWVPIHYFYDGVLKHRLALSIFSCKSPF